MFATFAGGMKRLSVARLGKRAFRRLDASVGASGPHDFAVREPHRSPARRLIAHRLIGLPCDHVSAPDEPASTASRPASVTIASRPSVGRDGEGYAGDLGEKGSGNIFAKGDRQATHLADAFANKLPNAENRRSRRVTDKHLYADFRR